MKDINYLKYKEPTCSPDGYDWCRLHRIMTIANMIQG